MREQTPPLSQDTLDILACPRCRNDIQLIKGELVCSQCRKAFPIKGGIPILLPEKGRDIKEK